MHFGMLCMQSKKIENTSLLVIFEIIWSGLSLKMINDTPCFVFANVSNEITP